MYPERFCRKIYAGQEVSSASVAVVKNTGKQELSKVSSVHSREQHSTHHCSPRHHRDTSQFVATTNSNKQPASHTDRVSSDPLACLLPLNFFAAARCWVDLSVCTHYTLTFWPAVSRGKHSSWDGPHTAGLSSCHQNLVCAGLL